MLGHRAAIAPRVQKTREKAWSGRNGAYLVAVQAAHSALDFCRVDVFDPAADCGFDVHATEEADHAGRVKEGIGLIRRHVVLETSCQVVTPRSVLMAHVFLLRRILLLAFEKTLCSTVVSVMRAQLLACFRNDLLAVTFLSSRSTSSWNPKTHISGGL